MNQPAAEASEVRPRTAAPNSADIPQGGAGAWCLQVGALASFAVALLHVACLFGGEGAARFFGAPRVVLTMVQQRSPAIIPVVLLVVGVLVTFGAYAWSAAGRMRRLPALRTGVIAVGVIYTLRGCLLAPQIAFGLRHPGVLPWQFFVFSAVSLLLGALHLGGSARRWNLLRPAAARA